MKKIMISLLLLTGCFPSYQAVETGCAKRFDPDTKPDLYMHCVDSAEQDIQVRRAILAHSFENAGQSFQRTTTNCYTTCNFGSCYTTCH